MLDSAAFDGPDFSGKTTLVQTVARMLEAAGIKVKIAHHPSADTETGQYARRMLVTGCANDVVARAMRADFEYSLATYSPVYDVVLFDRWAPVTIANQGDEGKEEIFRSKLCDQRGAPKIYVSLEPTFEDAVQRNKKRLEERGMDWDEAVSNRMFVSEDAWDAACARYRYAFQILTEGGNKFDLIKVPPVFDTAVVATDIVRRILAS